MADEGFRLPESSYEELVKIIKGYSTMKQEAGLSEISRATAMNSTVISRNNAFLTGVDILQGGQKKALTDQGRSLARALEHDQQEAIKRYWRELVEANDFLKGIVSAVRIRKGMELSSLQSHVAYSAGQSKRQGVMTGANAVIDILEAANLLEERDGKIMVVDDQTNSSEVEAPRTTEQVSYPRTGHTAPARTESVPILQGQVAGVAVMIQIQVQCAIDDLDQLGSKLRTLIDQISESATSDDNSVVGGQEVPE